MTLYCLEFVEGEYSDYSEQLLGIYSSPEMREMALTKYKSLNHPCYQEGSYNKGEYRKYEVELDKDLVFEAMQSMSAERKG